MSIDLSGSVGGIGDQSSSSSSEPSAKKARTRLYELASQFHAEVLSLSNSIGEELKDDEVTEVFEQTMTILRDMQEARLKALVPAAWNYYAKGQDLTTILKNDIRDMKYDDLRFPVIENISDILNGKTDTLTLEPIGPSRAEYIDDRTYEFFEPLLRDSNEVKRVIYALPGYYHNNKMFSYLKQNRSVVELCLECNRGDGGEDKGWLEEELTDFLEMLEVNSSIKTIVCEHPFPKECADRLIDALRKSSVMHFELTWDEEPDPEVVQTIKMVLESNKNKGSTLFGLLHEVTDLEAEPEPEFRETIIEGDWGPFVPIDRFFNF